MEVPTSNTIVVFLAIYKVIEVRDPINAISKEVSSSWSLQAMLGWKSTCSMLEMKWNIMFVQRILCCFDWMCLPLISTAFLDSKGFLRSCFCSLPQAVVLGLGFAIDLTTESKQKDPRADLLTIWLTFGTSAPTPPDLQRKTASKQKLKRPAESPILRTVVYFEGQLRPRLFPRVFPCLVYRSIFIYVYIS